MCVCESIWQAWEWLLDFWDYRLLGFSSSKCGILQEGRMTPKGSSGSWGLLLAQGPSHMAGPSPPQFLRVSSSVSEGWLPRRAVVITNNRASRTRDIFSHALKANVIYPARFQTCLYKFTLYFHFPFEVERGPLCWTLCAGPSLSFFGSR